MSSSRRFLDPLERTSEILFGLIMVWVVTGSISVAESGRADIRSVLLGAIGCNLAWGVVDAAMYLMGRFTERARGYSILKAIRQAREPDLAHGLIGELLPQGLLAMLGTSELEALRQRLNDLPNHSSETMLTRADFMGAAGVFLLVVSSTFPVIIPFFVMRDTGAALHLSHAIALAMLFLAGWSLGTHAGRPGWTTGLAMVAVGVTLSTLTFVLGG